MSILQGGKETPVRMMKTASLLLGCAFWLTGGQCETQVVDLTALVNCSSVDSMMSLQQKCFDLYDVDVKLPDAASLTNISVSPIDHIRNIMDLQDPNVTQSLCSNIDNYIKGYLCSRKINFKCTPDVPIMAAIFPPEDAMRKQQEFICSNFHNYNSTCVKHFLSNITDCVNVTNIVTAGDFLHENVSDILQRTFCISLELGDVCGRKYISKCGELTLQLYETNRPDSSSCRTATAKPDIAKLEVKCSDPASVRRGYLHCLSDNNILFLVPSQTTGDDTSDYILNAMTLSQNKQMCSNLAAYQKAINCSLSLQRECSEDLMKTTVPDPASVEHGFKRLCQHIDDFDTSCVASKTQNACAVRRRKRSLAEQIILRHLCEDDKLTRQCLVSAVTSCGSKTRSIYEDVLESQSPVKCLKHGAPLIG